MAGDYNQFWSPVFDRLEDLVFMVDKNFTLVKVNRSFIHFAGKKEIEIVGRKYHEVLISVEKFFSNYLPDNVLQVVASEKKEIYEHKLKKWLSINVIPVFDKTNTAMGFICFASDITQHKNIEKKLKKNKEELENVIWGGEKTKNAFKLLYHELADKKAELQETVEKLKRVLSESVDALSSAAEKRDPYTAGHQQRVASLACEIAKELVISDEQIEGISIAGVLHDIGKIYIPDALLTKISKLTDAEFGEIKNHAQFGYDILKKIEFSWPVAEIVFQHHERLNGSGYPRKLSGEKILLEARIIGVADVVEAIASPRPYRAALGINMALDEITRFKGILYDPIIVEICCMLFKEKNYRF